MYFLIYIVPATGGTGFGVFCAVVLALCMLISAAQYGITWLVAPIAFTMALLENGSLWWLLPVILGACIVINIVSAKMMDHHWQPLLTAGLLLAVITLLYVGLLTWEFIRGAENPWYAWLISIMVIPLLVPLITLFFYSNLNAWMALSSFSTLWMDWRPCVGALCSFAGMIGAAFCLQGLIEGVIGWFGESSFLNMVRAHLEPEALKFLTFNLVSEEKNVHILYKMKSIINFIAGVPAWWRFFLGLALAVGCSIGEHMCSGGDVLF